MSARKKCKLVDAADISDVPDPKPIDWTLCCLCQSVTSDKLICPAKSDVGAGYKTIGDNLAIFQRIGKQPIPVNISLLGEGVGISQTLEQHKAQWHNSCRLKCSSSRIARAQPTQSISEDINEASPSTLHYIRPRSSNTCEDGRGVSKCFFCDEPESKDHILHDAMMPKVTERVNRCAIELQDQKLIAKLSSGDLVAQDARYHANCLVALYNSHSRCAAEKQANISDGVSYGIALAELIGFIEETRYSNKDVIPVFRLVDLVRLYSNRLQDLGIEQSGRVHSTDLKNRLLANIPDIRAFRQGRDMILTFHSDVGTALKEATLTDYDDEALCLAKAAQIVRRDMQQKSSTFSGTFESNCQEESVPKSLLTLVDMIMKGTNIKNKYPENYQSALSVAQILQFNSSTKTRNLATCMYHSRDKETPLPVYVGLLIHGRTRKRELVDTFFQLGLYFL